MTFVRRHPIIVGATAVLLVLAYYWFVFSVLSYRYRLTLEVDDPSGKTVVAGVLEPYLRHQTRFISGRSVVPKLRGEAIALKLRDGRLLIALLAGGGRPSSPDAPIRLPREVFAPGSCQERICSWEEMKGVSGQRPLSQNEIPALAILSDPSNPASARYLAVKDVTSVLGGGSSVSATIAVTNDPVTRNLRDAIPWIDNEHELSRFWEAIVHSGFVPDGSLEPETLLQRGE